jgi:Xaa-Pro dipeptidase
MNGSAEEGEHVKSSHERFLGRIHLLQERLSEEHCDCALLLYSRDVFYYTGVAQPAYFLVSPGAYFLFVRSGISFAVQEAGIEKDCIFEEGNLANIQKTIAARSKCRRVGTELDILPVNRYQELCKTFPSTEFVDASPVILDQRSRKDPSEIRHMRQACEALDAGNRAVLNELRPGMTELVLSSIIETAQRRCGHEGAVFMRLPDFFMSRGPLASGPNTMKFSGVVSSVTGVGLSSALPAGPSRRRIERGDLVVVDIPTLVRGYHADQSRTYILGKPGEEIKDLYGGLKETADYLIPRIRPGVRCSDLYRLAETKAKELSLGDAFMSFSKGKRSHMIGHGIGLECSEPPVISRENHSPIKEDMVVTIELHMRRRSAGTVKLEDMVHVGHDKNEVLTISQRSLAEIQ